MCSRWECILGSPPCDRALAFRARTGMRTETVGAAGRGRRAGESARGCCGAGCAPGETAAWRRAEQLALGHTGALPFLGGWRRGASGSLESARCPVTPRLSSAVRVDCGHSWGRRPSDPQRSGHPGGAKRCASRCERCRATHSRGAARRSLRINAASPDRRMRVGYVYSPRALKS